MPISRYDQRKIISNRSDLYTEHREVRGVNIINHYDTMKIRPDAFEKAKNLIFSYHTWKLGDHYYKLAEDFYGDPSLWYLIGLFNMKPTDADVKVGDLIIIPTPLNRVLEIFGI